MKKIFFILFSFFIANVASAIGGTQDPNTLPNPLGTTEAMKDPNYVIGKIINSVLGVVGTIALVMFIYGGLRWMTSAGEKDGVTTGKETIKWATFGLIIIFMAYAIINFVLKDILMQGQN